MDFINQGFAYKHLGDQLKEKDPKATAMCYAKVAVCFLQGIKGKEVEKSTDVVHLLRSSSRSLILAAECFLSLPSTSSDTFLSNDNDLEKANSLVTIALESKTSNKAVVFYIEAAMVFLQHILSDETKNIPLADLFNKVAGHLNKAQELYRLLDQSISKLDFSLVCAHLEVHQDCVLNANKGVGSCTVESNKDIFSGDLTTKAQANSFADNTTTKIPQSVATPINTILPYENASLENVIGMENAKLALKHALEWKHKYPEVPTYRAVLLYGPPGVGKSYLMSACITACGWNCVNFSVSRILDQYLGNSEKYVELHFKYAFEHEPCVIYMDEIDSLMGKRPNSKSENVGTVKTAILVQMTMAIKYKRVVIIAATNRPSSFDSAFLRRFDEKIYIPLPNRTERIQLLNQLLKAYPSDITLEDLIEISKYTERFSGDDLQNVVKKAYLDQIEKAESVDPTTQDNKNIKLKKKMLLNHILNRCPTTSVAEKCKFDMAQTKFGVICDTPRKKNTGNVKSNVNIKTTKKEINLNKQQSTTDLNTILQNTPQINTNTSSQQHLEPIQTVFAQTAPQIKTRLIKIPFFRRLSSFINDM